MSNELKPCPFCGGNNLIIIDADTWSRFKLAAVICQECKVTTPCFYLEEEAIVWWNTRHQDPTRIDVDGNETSIAAYCAEKYGARQAQDKTAIILDYLQGFD